MREEMGMVWVEDVWGIVFCLVAVALGYQLRFAEATLLLGRLLSGTSTGTGFQDAITPPVFSSLTFGLWGLILLILAFAFYQYGIALGLAAAFSFYILVAMSRLFLPRPESPHFHGIVMRSMIRRHADYVRTGDQLRAAAMADLLHRAGTLEALRSINDLASRSPK